MEQPGEPEIRRDLLLLATEVAGLDADLADPLLQERLAVVTDALAHAIVDLADGVPARVRTRWPARPTTRRPPRVTAGAVDTASCSAMAAELRRVAWAVEGSATGRAGGTRIATAAEDLAQVLQDYVQEVATTPAGAAAPLPQATTTRLQQQLRRIHGLVSPQGGTRTTRPAGTS